MARTWSSTPWTGSSPSRPPRSSSRPRTRPRAASGRASASPMISASPRARTLRSPKRRRCWPMWRSPVPARSWTPMDWPGWTAGWQPGQHPRSSPPSSRAWRRRRLPSSRSRSEGRWAMSAKPDDGSQSAEVAGSAVVAALEDAWTAVRAHHADVPQVVIILGAGSEARKGLFKWGYFAVVCWYVAGANRPEVLVSGEGLRRGARDVLATLMHEAAHGMANTRQIQDTSRQGRWHNRRFATLAEELGLKVTQDQKTGWSQTHLTEQLADRYADQLTGLSSALLLWRHAELQLGTATTSRNLLACSCECGRKLRVAKTTLEQAPIICSACDEPFTPERQLTRKRQLTGPSDSTERSIGAEATAAMRRDLTRFCAADCDLNHAGTPHPSWDCNAPDGAPTLTVEQRRALPNAELPWVRYATPLLLSTSEVDRLRSPITAAMLRLQVDEAGRDLPSRERLSGQLHAVDQRLIRGQLDAQY